MNAAPPPSPELEQALAEIAHLRAQVDLGDETNRRLVKQINDAEATIEVLRRGKESTS